MKIRFLYIAILSILASGSAHSQGLNSTGKINNVGTIKIRSGQVSLNQDTITGRVEMLQNYKATQFQVPNIVYKQLLIGNDARHFVLDSKDVNGNTKNLTILDSFLLRNNTELTTFYLGVTPNNVLARSAVVNMDSKYTGPKDLILQNETQEQDLIANGKFSRLNIDNPYGVNVLSGGFEVEEKLTLSRGDFRNSKVNNFVMKDTSEIVRFVGSKLSEEPEFKGVVDVTYQGLGSMNSSGEIPSNANSLRKLKVWNSDSLNLTRNAQVNDSLSIGGRLFALNDTLTLATTNEPEFLNPLKSEIGGTMRRNKFITGKQFKFHNSYTFFNFTSEENRRGISQIVLDIRPTTFPRYDSLNEKIYRTIDMTMFDNSNNEITEGFDAEFGIGWRNADGEIYDEMNGLGPSFADLLLQRWEDTEYQDLQSEPPSNDLNYKWSFTQLNNLINTGSYAIGLSSINNIAVQMKVLLEGSYLENSHGQMRTNLWNGMQGNLLMNINPTEFPFTELKGYDFSKLKSVPDSVVDWVVVQFTNIEYPENTFTKLLLLRKDGRLLDINGNPRIKLSNDEFKIQIISDLFEVVILHRNHSSVKSLNPIELRQENNKLVYDFSNPEFVYGGTAALKLVEIGTDYKIFGMKGGYLINDEISKNEMMNVLNPFTELQDFIKPWNKLAETGYLLYDYDMDGIITTKDYNMSWNNRNK